MKYVKKILITFLIVVFVVNMAVPVQETPASAKYGVVIGNKAYDYRLYNNLTVISPAGNVMIKAYSVCKALGLFYSYNDTTKKLTIKNPNNEKYLVFTKGSKNFTYYSGTTAAASEKTAAYKFYYDTVTKSNVIHMSTLRYIVAYNYYKDVTDNYYGEMGYRGVAVFSIHSYNSYDIPITEEVLNFINAQTFTSAEKLIDAVRINLVMRKTAMTFNTNRGVMDDIGSSNSIWDIIKSIDIEDTAKDADYLMLLIDNIGQSWSSSNMKYVYPDGREEVVKTDSDPASLTIEVQYESTLKQERIVDSKIAGILKSLKLGNASDYEKVKMIHDYIINLASYDTTYTKSTAYNLLVDKTAVCEGYSLSAYRLFKDAGLECKIITGYGNGENHAWNIVKVDGNWYNIDLTWDDPISNTGEPILDYDYFLKSEADFPNHQRLDEYNTAEFLEAYKIAEVSYQ